MPRCELTKAEIECMKREVIAFVKLHGGGVAHIKWHKQNQYVEAYIATYMTDRNIGKVRLYADGRLYTMKVNSTVIEHSQLRSKHMDKLMTFRAVGERPGKSRPGD